MNRVFVDTSGWVALKLQRDRGWEKATAFHRKALLAGTRYITSNYVLDEACTLLLERGRHDIAVAFGRKI